MKVLMRIGALALLLGAASSVRAQGYYGAGYVGGYFSGMPLMQYQYGGFSLNPYGSMSWQNPYNQMPVTGATNVPVDLGSPYGYTFPGGGQMQPTQFVVYPDYGTVPEVTPDEQQALAAQTSGVTAPVVVQRAPESIDANIAGDGKLHVKWTGDASTVEAISFTLLDKNKKPIKINIANKAPAEAAFTLTNKTAYYRVQVQYVDGTSNTVVSPL